MASINNDTTNNDPTLKIDGEVCTDDTVCAGEALRWMECTQRHIREPKRISHMCDGLGTQFDVCITQWRNTGCTKRLKGIRRGHPPNQCVEMSRLIARCVEENNYDFEACASPSIYFKQCVKGLYGGDYILH